MDSPMRPSLNSCFLFSIVAASLCPTSAYAASYKVGSFTKSTATGSQVIAHGLGVAPSAIIFWTEARTSTTFAVNFRFGFGMTDGTTNVAFSMSSENGVTTSTASRRIASTVITIVQWDGTLVAEATFTSWNATNLTINWTTNDTNADVIHFIAIGGAGVSAKLINWTSPTSTGNYSVTGIGFQPDFVLHAYGGNGLTGAPPTTGTAGSFGIGAMTKSGSQWANHVDSANSASPTNTTRYESTSESIVMASSQAINKQASFVSMDSSGFTLDWTTTSALASQIISLALKGINASVGSFNKTTGVATAAQSIGGVGFTPGLVLLTSVQNTTQSTPQTQTYFGIGASDGTNQGSTALYDANNVSTSNVGDIDNTTNIFMKVNNSTPTLNAEAGLTGMNSNGFALNWTTNDAVATEILYLAFESNINFFIKKREDP